MIFNITVTFTGIYRRMFTEDKLYIRVTKVKDIYRIFVLKKNTDETGNITENFIDYFDFLKNIKKYNITEKHIEKLKHSNVTNLKGEELVLDPDDFDIPLNPIRELDFFIRENITGRRNEFKDFIENTVNTMYVTTSYIDYKFTDVDTAYAKIYGAYVREKDNNYVCDIKCYVKLKDLDNNYFYATFEIDEYIVSGNPVYPAIKFIEIPDLFGRYINIKNEYLEKINYIAYNDIEIFTREHFISELEKCKVIIDPLRNTLIPYRILIDVCSKNCPAKEFDKGSLFYETAVLNVKNSILCTYNVYVKRQHIIDVFKMLRK